MTVADLIRLWKQFCSYMSEVHPHAVDADYNFENFICWLEEKEEPPM